MRKVCSRSCSASACAVQQMLVVQFKPLPWVVKLLVRGCSNVIFNNAVHSSYRSPGGLGTRRPIRKKRDCIPARNPASVFGPFRMVRVLSSWPLGFSGSKASKSFRQQAAAQPATVPTAGPLSLGATMTPTSLASGYCKCLVEAGPFHRIICQCWVSRLALSTGVLQVLRRVPHPWLTCSFVTPPSCTNSGTMRL